MRQPLNLFFITLASLIPGACLAASGAAPLTDSAATGGVAEIDAIALFSPGVRALYAGDPGSRLQHHIDVANSIFDVSGLAARLHLVKQIPYDFSDSNSSSAVLSAAVNDKEIQTLRDQYQADVVLIYRPYRGDGNCGLAFMGGTMAHERTAYAHVSADCGSYVTAHEVGHLLGLGHSHRQQAPGIFDYAQGYGVDGLFTTVMAGPEAFQQAARVLRFSDPDVLCAGLPCGVPVGKADAAHAVAALRQTIPVIASYRDASLRIEANEEPLTQLQQAQADYAEAQRQSRLALASVKAAKTDLTQLGLNQINSMAALVSIRLRLEDALNTGADPQMITDLKQSLGRAEAEYNGAVRQRSDAVAEYRKRWFELYLPALRELSDRRLSYQNQLSAAQQPSSQLRNSQ